jgi:hypothetical protein
MSVTNFPVGQAPSNSHVVNRVSTPDFPVPQPAPFVAARQLPLQATRSVSSYPEVVLRRAQESQSMTAVRPSCLPLETWAPLNNHTKKILTTPGNWAWYLVSHPNRKFTAPEIWSHCQTRPRTAKSLVPNMSKFIDSHPKLGFVRYDLPGTISPVFSFNGTPA